MKFKKSTFILIFSSLFLLSGCQTSSTESQSEPKQVVEEDSEKIEVPPFTNTYTTTFAQTTGNPSPTFQLDYFEDWKVLTQEVDTTHEKFVLTNTRGTTITYLLTTSDSEPPVDISTCSFARIDVSKVADSTLAPLQEENYILAKLKITGSAKTTGEKDYFEVDGSSFYVVIPEEMLNTKADISKPIEEEFSFSYDKTISLLAQTPSGVFTTQEEQEIIAILQSFRTQP